MKSHTTGTRGQGSARQRVFGPAADASAQGDAGRAILGAAAQAAQAYLRKVPAGPAERAAEISAAVDAPRAARAARPTVADGSRRPAPFPWLAKTRLDDRPARGSDGRG